jgi:hypothetical protein
LVLIIYFACFAGNASKINPPQANSITVKDGKDGNHKNIEIVTNTESDTKFIIQNLDSRPNCAPNNNGLM